MNVEIGHNKVNDGEKKWTGVRIGNDGFTILKSLTHVFGTWWLFLNIVPETKAK